MSNTSILIIFTRQDFRFSFLKRLNNSVDMCHIDTYIYIDVLSILLIEITFFFSNYNILPIFRSKNINGVLFSDNSHFKALLVSCIRIVKSNQKLIINQGAE